MAALLPGRLPDPVDHHPGRGRLHVPDADRHLQGAARAHLGGARPARLHLGDRPLAGSRGGHHRGHVAVDAVRVHRPAGRPRESRPGGPRGGPRRRRQPLAELSPHHLPSPAAGDDDDHPHPPDRGLQDHRHAEHPARRRARDGDPVDDAPGVHRLEHAQPRPVGGGRLSAAAPRDGRGDRVRQLRPATGDGAAV